MQRFNMQRSGISLMEVLISIGVIALGIFGVASLIPLAQFQVAKGTAKTRQAALGQRAVAEFRVRDMGSPGTLDKPKWQAKSNVLNSAVFVADATDPAYKQLQRRGICLDPLGVAGTNTKTHYRFPATANDAVAAVAMPRVSLRKIFDPTAPADLAITLARDLCFLRDDLVFDRPSQQELQPNRQFFVHQGQPIKSYAKGSMSWFATISPTVSPAGISTSDEFVLSIVVVQDRVVKRPPYLNPQVEAFTEENFARTVSAYPGEVSLIAPPTVEGQITVDDLTVGDWILLVKKGTGPNASWNASDSIDKVYRWTQIIGANDSTGGSRSFTIANDDFLKPGVPGRAIIMRNVRAVYEKTMRIENSTAWN